MNKHYKAIKKLKGSETYEIQHPQLKEIQLKVYREHMIQEVLGVPTAFYGATFKVHDNGDTIHQEHHVDMGLEEVSAYIENLCETKTRQEFFYVRSLREKGLQVGDIIQFSDQKEAIIVPLDEVQTDLIRSVYYVPLKKDGTPSKVKPRILYNNSVFEVIRE